MAGDTEMILILAGLGIGAFVLLKNPNLISDLTGGGSAAAAPSPAPASGASSSSLTWGQNPASSTPCDKMGQPCTTAGALGGTSNWCKCVASSSSTPASPTPSQTPSTSTSPYGQYPPGTMYMDPNTGQLIPLQSPLTTTLSPVDGGVLIPGQGVPLNPGQFVVPGQPLPRGCKRLSNGIIVCQPTSTRHH